MWRRLFLILLLVLGGCSSVKEIAINYPPPEPVDGDGMPIISNLIFTVTDTTIVASWNTDTSSDSNLAAGGKAAIDNGVAANSTVHQAVVTGLTPNTSYSCIVTSGGSSSSPQNVTTAVAPVRTALTSVLFGSVTTTTNDGDIPYNFLSSDNNTYIIRDDAQITGTPANMQVDKITNESTLAISQVNALTAYGGYATNNGTDGPLSAALSNKINGLFGLNGRLFVFCGRHYLVGSVKQQYYGNVIADNGDHGATWNNWFNTSTFNANGVPAYPNSGNNSVAPFFFGNKSTWGWVSPVVYGADDGTLGYITSGNGIDGGNAYVYFLIIEGPNDASDYIYLGRMSRIRFANLDTSDQQFWVGPSSPTALDFTTDSNWTSSTSGLTKIIQATGKIGWQNMIYIPAVNRYLLFSEYRPNPASTSNTVWDIYDGRTPAGPFTKIGTQTNSPAGYYNMAVLHRTAATNAATQNINLNVVFSGDFNNPTYYKIAYSSLTLLTGGAVANAFVQARGSTSLISGVNPTFAYTSNVTSGDLLAIAFRYNGSGASHISNITSTATTGNWTIVYDSSDAGTPAIQGGWAFAFATSSAACTITINTGGFSMVGLCLAIGEWSGPALFRSASAVKVANQTTMVSNAINPLAGDLLIGVAENGAVATANAFSATGYVVRATGANGTSGFVCIADNLTATGGSTTITFTCTENDSAVAATVGLGAFYLSSGSSAGTQNDMLQLNRWCTRMWP